MRTIELRQRHQPAACASSRTCRSRFQPTATSSATDDLEDGGWYSDANSSVQVVDDKLYFVGISSLSGYLRELIFKTGGELITGVFSEFTFTDVTDEFSPQVVTPNNGVEPTANGYSSSYLVLYDTNSFETTTVSQEYKKITLS